jgi:hypothetical protein
VRYCRPLVLTLLVAAGVVSVLSAGCGSSSDRSSAASSSSSHPSPAQIQREQQQAVSFADCMRSRGVSDFPDPTTSPHEFKFSLSPSSPESHSPAFQSAAAACQHLLPDNGAPNQAAAQTPAQIAAFLAFARCIRSHGFPAFPDPTSTGELTHEMLASAGIDIHQPAIVRAADACVSVTHGNVTKADVARFVAGQ